MAQDPETQRRFRRLDLQHTPWLSLPQALSPSLALASATSGCSAKNS